MTLIKAYGRLYVRTVFAIYNTVRAADNTNLVRVTDGVPAPMITDENGEPRAHLSVEVMIYAKGSRIDDPILLYVQDTTTGEMFTFVPAFNA